MVTLSTRLTEGMAATTPSDFALATHEAAAAAANFVSQVMRSILRPCTPPDALNASTAATTPSWNSCSGKGARPVMSP